MQLTVPNLRNGIKLFRERWPGETDFHAAFYAKLRSDLADGVTELAWHRLVDDLFAWRACRPLSKDEVLRRGLALLPRLNAERQRLSSSTSDSKITLRNAEWVDVAGLFKIAGSIKLSSSPVFPSKLCHFLVPDVYPVCDGEFAGTSARRYPEFWTEAHDAWGRCAERQRLIDTLKAAIPAANLTGYPSETKIVDLCLAGSRVGAG